MKLSYFSYTNKGGRPNNEDSLRCQELDGRGVFVLADGLGGHQSGETASAIAVEAILAGASAAPSLDGGTLLNQLAEANRQVMEGQKEPGCEDMKTTAVVLGIETSPEDGALSDGSASSGEGRAAWAHVGDSRLYYFAGGELAAVTRDHSVTYTIDLSEFVSAGATNFAMNAATPSGNMESWSTDPSETEHLLTIDSNGRAQITLSDLLNYDSSESTSRDNATVSLTLNFEIMINGSRTSSTSTLSLQTYYGLTR